MQLNKANSSDTDTAPFLDLTLLVAGGMVSSGVMIDGMILVLKW